MWCDVVAEVPGFGVGFGDADDRRSGCGGSELSDGEEPVFVGGRVSGGRESAGKSQSTRSPKGNRTCGDC